MKPQLLLFPALILLSACGQPKDAAPAGAMPPASVTLAPVAQEEMADLDKQEFQAAKVATLLFLD